MVGIVWTPTAQLDVQRLVRFLLPRSPQAARRAADAIHQAVLRLARFPHAGRPVPELGGSRRELPVPFGDSGYVVLYLLGSEEIEILSVKHQREAGYSLSVP